LHRGDYEPPVPRLSNGYPAVLPPAIILHPSGVHGYGFRISDRVAVGSRLIPVVAPPATVLHPSGVRRYAPKGHGILTRGVTPGIYELPLCCFLPLLHPLILPHIFVT
jgi:hypothetical protein